jgi:hypothetical protein
MNYWMWAVSLVGILSTAVRSRGGHPGRCGRQRTTPSAEAQDSEVASGRGETRAAGPSRRRRDRALSCRANCGQAVSSRQESLRRNEASRWHRCGEADGEPRRLTHGTFLVQSFVHHVPSADPPFVATDNSPDVALHTVERSFAGKRLALLHQAIAAMNILYFCPKAT